jgi:tetratricopeptide (TPR) repeat protein
LVTTRPVAGLSADQCRDELDSAVSLFHNQAIKVAETRLLQLADQCQHLPQINHNLGVLAGRQNQWPAAIDYFKRSLEADPRAAMTQDHLLQIYRYRASLAYAKALNTTSTAPPPELHMQDASRQNPAELLHQPHTPLRTPLHNISTVDYELYDWWHTALQANNQGHQAHYVNGYSPPLAAQPNQADWQSVQREISFTAQDAVAVLTYQENGQSVSTLLLMRLQGNRWKIYQETRL